MRHQIPAYLIFLWEHHSLTYKQCDRCAARGSDFAAGCTAEAAVPRVKLDLRALTPAELAAEPADVVNTSRNARGYRPPPPQPRTSRRGSQAPVTGPVTPVAPVRVKSHLSFLA